MKNLILDKVAYAIKHYPIVQILYRGVLSSLFKLVGLFIITDERLVLLVSYGGKQYSDSPKVMFETMKQDARFKHMTYVWAFENPEDIQIEGAKKIQINSLSYFITALKAKVWITNVNIERGLNFKKKNTIYLNTWHGTGPKKGGNAVKGRKDYDFSRVDIFCCDGEYTKTVFKKWFNAKEENMVACGRPREDELLKFTSNDRIAIRKKLKIPANKKVCLYMPTWREYGNQPINLDKWNDALSAEYILLVRAHHFAQDNVFSSCQSGFWRDVSNYSNVNELYCVADVLISDYSSAFFDYGLLGKPMICYAYDYRDYEESTGLFIDLRKEFPNGIIEREDDVISFVQNMNYEEECIKTQKFCKKYISRPDNATQICLDALYDKWEQKV